MRRTLALPKFRQELVKMGKRVGRIVSSQSSGFCHGSPAMHAGVNTAVRSAPSGCPWRDVRTMLREVGMRPTRQRLPLGFLLFGKGDRHVTAEILYEEACNAKV